MASDNKDKGDFYSELCTLALIYRIMDAETRASGLFNRSN